jgi:predicted nuclease of predicted toxin-antitoxin system
MNIKLDENMPAGLAPVLADLGHNVETVVQEGMEGWADPDIWERVQQESRFLTTQDLDFSDVRRFAPGTHQGILLVRLRAPGRIALTEIVRELFRKENVSDWPGCFIVLTETKLRIRRPIKAI